MKSKGRKMENTRDIRRERLRKKKRRMNILFACMTILIIVLSILSAYLFYLYNKEKNKAIEAVNQEILIKQEVESEQNISLQEAEEKIEQAKEEISEEYLNTIRTMMEDGDGTLALLETLYPNNIVVPDSGRYYFFDISETLTKNDYQNDNFVFPTLNEETNKYEGEATYQVDGRVISHKGIDVSKFQGDIEWDKVAKDGVEFAFIRLGYRGYGSGKIVVDEKYEKNIIGCNEAGIDTGVYFFTEALNEKEGKEEADFVLEQIKDYRIDLPIVIDVEESASKTDSRTRDLTKEDRTKAVIAFCERIKENGHEVMIYGNLKSLMLMLDLEELEDYDKWFAYYHYPLHFPYKYRVWQYSATGKVNGIKGNADLNIAFY